MSKNAQDWRHLYPFASQWLHLPQGSVHYLDEKPPQHNTSSGTLLFVHGNPTWSFHWRRLIEALRPRHRCVAIDHLGCGLSDKPQQLFTLEDHIQNLCTLVSDLNIDRVTLIAQDWGGAIGLGAMLRLRERLDRIVLFNTGAFPPRYIPWRIRVCRWPVIGEWAVRGANAFSRAALKMTLARHSRLEPDVAAGYLAPYDSWAHRCAVYGFVKDIPNPSGRSAPRSLPNTLPLASDTARVLSDIERDLASLADRPACLVWGMRDWCFRPDCLDRFLNAWPNAQVHKLADVGHWVVEDAPEESLAHVQAFLHHSSESKSLRRQDTEYSR